MLFRWLTVAWVIVTLVALAVPGASLPEAPVHHFDKLIHVLLFAVGTMVALAGWPDRPRTVLALLLLFAPVTEVWQALLPTGREAELMDVVANVAGIAVGWLGARVTRRVARS